MAFCVSQTRALVKDNMALYQHSAHCPSALQWFLDENPEYWPFIPIKNDQHNDEAEEREEEMDDMMYDSYVIFISIEFSFCKE
jgi:hypothetical protein